MKHCQICGTQFDAETCPNCGEASWVVAREDEKKPEQPKKGGKR